MRGKKWMPRHDSQRLFDLMLNGQYEPLDSDRDTLVKELKIRRSRVKALTWQLYNNKELTKGERELIKTKRDLETIAIKFAVDFNNIYNIYEEKTNE